MNALNSALVVFGGILSLAGEFLMPMMMIEYEKRVLRWNREATTIVFAKYGFDAAAMGGVAAVYQTILSQPNLMDSAKYKPTLLAMMPNASCRTPFLD